MDLIESLESKILLDAIEPEFVHAWRTYLNEAKWGWLIIAPVIDSLPANSSVLEVGAGSQALTAQVASRDIIVTALEPSGVGFSVMRTLGEKVRAISHEAGIDYNIIDTTGENFNQVNQFDFAFSINVMEHVQDINAVLDNVVTSLKVGGLYQFVCPNYSFPFEPHFNVPTLINKRLTNIFIRSIAIRLSKASDPTGLWSSLNWITVRQIEEWASKTENVKVEFSSRALEMYATRARSDEIFRARHRFIARIFRFFYPLMMLAIRKVPKVMSPFIDVSIRKLS